MRIALIDTFYEDSHRIWAEGLQRSLDAQVDIYSGSAFNWKWKMVGGTISLAEALNASDLDYDKLIVTDMVNLPLFKSLLDHRYQTTPIVLYFHENQITYPWSPTDMDVAKNRDHHYGFINFSSALIANTVCFNSAYHQRSFLGELPRFLNMFPDDELKQYHKPLQEKSHVLPIGLDLPAYHPSEEELPVFLWNHRWEYDKKPDLFFKVLFELKDKGVPFKVIVLGKSYKKSPPIFALAKERLDDELIHFGYAKSREEYLKLMTMANVLMITSHQDFFGISIVEAIAAGCFPLLPNRLSYPEHIASDEASNCIYESDQVLLSKVEEIVGAKTYLNTKKYSDYVQKYDWRNLRERYNDLILT